MNFLKQINNRLIDWKFKQAIKKVNPQLLGLINNDIEKADVEILDYGNRYVVKIRVGRADYEFSGKEKLNTGYGFYRIKCKNSGGGIYLGDLKELKETT